MNALREKLQGNEVVCGTQAFLGCPEILEIFGTTGFDFIFICAEHPAYGIERVSACVKACQNAGTPALVRLPEYDVTFTKKILDLGVDAVLFPMIRSVEDANSAMQLCLYPPYGRRGFGPMSAVRWGMESESEFVKNAPQQLVRMIQIEHIEAVEQLGEIVKIPYIDAYIFGPNDLAASMGHINDMYHPEVQEQIYRSVKILRENGKRFGVSLGSADMKKIAYWKSIGMNIFSVGADFAFLRDAALKLWTDLKKRM